MSLAPDRDQFWNASDAPAMLGISPYETRDEFLHRVKYGLDKSWSDWQQKMLLDKGHGIEAQARPVAEAILGKALPPRRVTNSRKPKGLGATLDGCHVYDDLGSDNWECKSLNKAIREAFGEVFHMRGIMSCVVLPDYLNAQMEQGLMCNDSERCLFTAKNDDDCVHCWYSGNATMRQRIIDGWAQFERDLAAMPDVMPEPEYQQTLIPAKSASLPALRVELSGMVTHSNFAEYQSKAIAVFKGVNKSPTTDQDFADAAEFIKMAKGVRDTIKQVKSQALKQTQTIDELFAGLDAIDAEAMRAERDLEAIVKARKDKLKADKLRAAQSAYAAHIAALSVAKYMPPVVVNFAEAIKGKSSFDSMQQALDAELLRAQSAANATAAKIQKNLDLIEGAQNPQLFADIKALVFKEHDDLENVISLRVQKYEAEQKRLIEEAAVKEVARLEKNRLDEEAKAAHRAQLEALRMREQARADEAEKMRLEALAVAAEQVVCAALGLPSAIDDVPESEQCSGLCEPDCPELPIDPPSVLTISAPPVLATPENTINIGRIISRIDPDCGLKISRAFLEKLGFKGVAVGNFHKYLESDFSKICAAIIEHLRGVK